MRKGEGRKSLPRKQRAENFRGEQGGEPDIRAIKKAHSSSHQMGLPTSRRRDGIVEKKKIKSIYESVLGEV